MTMSSDLDFDWRLEFSVGAAQERLRMGMLFKNGFATGISIALAFLCCHLFWRKTLQGRPSMGSKVLYATVLMSLIVFLGESVYHLGRIHKYWRVPCLTEDNTSCYLEETLDQSRTICLEDWIDSLLNTVIRLLGDYIAVNRARAIVQNRIWLSRTMITMFILTVVVAAASLLAFREWNCIDTTTAYYAQPYLALIVVVLSFLTNLVATASVFSTLWSHRRLLNQSFGSMRQRPTRTQRILAIIAESGIIFAIIQMFQLCSALILFFGNAAVRTKYPVLDWVITVAIGMLQTALGLYPGLVFVGIQLQPRLQESGYSLVEFISISQQETRNG